MIRVIEAELLDSLPAHHPEALQSRADLARINLVMRNASHLAAAIEASRRRASEIVDLGGGDGKQLLRVCLLLKQRGVIFDEAIIVDQKRLETPWIHKQFAEAGMQCRFVTSDVFAFFEASRLSLDAVCIANLFLHHFQEDLIRRLFEKISRSMSFFAACEPRRSRSAIYATVFLPLLGCNAVTRHDARLSVRAGFEARELSELWPKVKGWQCAEYFARPFSHLFSARRQEESA